MSGPFAKAARWYARLGYAVLPLDGKVLIVKGRTGFHGIDADTDEVDAWISRYPAANIGIRLPEGVIGIDVDAYDGKAGAATIEQWESELGPLPPTVRSTSRTDGISGIRLFRVEAGNHYRGELGPGSGVEVIQHAHRYMVVAPSLHPEGERAYRWLDAEGQPIGADDLPDVGDLPELPIEWQLRLQVLEEQYVREPVAPYTGPAPADITPEAAALRERLLARLDECTAAATPDGRGYTGPAWDLRTFAVACSLRELANSGWSGYSHDDALADLLARAPRDSTWTEADIREKWRVAMNRSSAAGELPAPDPTDAFSPFGWIFETVATGAPGADTAAEQEPEDELPSQSTAPDEIAERQVTVAAQGSAGWMEDANLAPIVMREVLAGTFAWAGPLGWMAWDGKRWDRCNEARPLEVVRAWLAETFRMRVVGAESAKEVREQAVLVKLGKALAVLTFCRGLLEVDPVAFDAHPDLLNVGNGVVDLRTGTLMPHNPALLLTKITPTHYLPHAPVHEDWIAAQAALPAESLAYMQSRIGQACTGHTPPDDVLAVCVGGGENGKSAVLGVAARVLGEHAVYVSDRVLLAESGAHTTELMDLRGARMALLEETPEARRLSVARLKKVIGTPKISARLMRQDSMTFTATHSLFVTTNYRPVIEETDHGTWRRLALVTFPYTFRKPGEELLADTDRIGDPGLKERLIPAQEDRAAPAHASVLAWIVQGAMAYYAARESASRTKRPIMPSPPAQVVADTYAWRTESDLVLGYLSERMVVDRNRVVMTNEVVEDFNAWLAGRGNTEWSVRTFTARFESHDEVKKQHIAPVRMRATDGLSRPAAEGRNVVRLPAPQRFSGYAGVRFRQPSDEDAPPFAAEA